MLKLLTSASILVLVSCSSETVEEPSEQVLAETSYPAAAVEETNAPAADVTETPLVPTPETFTDRLKDKLPSVEFNEPSFERERSAPAPKPAPAPEHEDPGPRDFGPDRNRDPAPGPKSEPRVGDIRDPLGPNITDEIE